RSFEALQLLASTAATDRAPIFRYVPVVLFQGSGEAMMSLVVAHEIQVIGVCRMQGCKQRVLTRIGDWSGRKSGVAVSVVRRGVMKIGSVYRAAVPISE